MHGCYMQVIKVHEIQDCKAFFFFKEDSLICFPLDILLVSFFSNDAIHKTLW